MWTLKIAFLGLLLVGLSLVPVRASLVKHPCLQQADDSAVDTCRQLARQIKSDRYGLIKLGRALELRGRYQVAIVVYKEATEAHPKDRELLKQLIRARAELRRQKLLAVAGGESVENRPSENNSACWRLRWMSALQACQVEMKTRGASDRLYERLADVYRSMGQSEKALANYRNSLNLNPGNRSAKNKHAALIALTKNDRAIEDKVETAASISKPKLSSVLSSKVEPAPPPVAQKLQLLNDLRQRQLISDDEYFQRREQILESSFTTAPQQVALNANSSASSTYRGKLGIDLAGQYHALVIGNNRYDHFPDLHTAVSDARAVSRLLQNRYGFEVNTLLDVSRYEVLRALSELRRQLKLEDKLLIYYAGHGFLDESTRRGYWLPVDAEKNNFANWISTNDITDTLSGVAAKHAMVVADSCFSGSLLRNTGLVRLDEREALLKRLAGKRSRTVLTSGGLEPVLDDGDGRHSIFARAFIDVLRENRDVLEAGRLFNQIREKVVLNADQTPQYEPIRQAGHEGGDFLFIPQKIKHQ